MIGDSYKQDYEGARVLNIDSILLDRNNECNEVGVNNLFKLWSIGKDNTVMM